LVRLSLEQKKTFPGGEGEEGRKRGRERREGRGREGGEGRGRGVPSCLLLFPTLFLEAPSANQCPVRGYNLFFY
jgi:hypothetical protein